MRVGTQVRLVKDDEGLYMMEVYMDGHYRTRYIDCHKAPRREWNDIIIDNISEVEDRIDMDIELEEEDTFSEESKRQQKYDEQCERFRKEHNEKLLETTND